ncbi:MAG: TIGR03943 family protein [Oscillospiraceae bacterium]|nr:TIGR03943 family protein [Oscillospiraceae bacterium]
MSVNVKNRQAVWELICSGGFAILLLYLLASGAYLSYVAPRMKPYLYFMAAVLLLWSGRSLLQLKHPRHRSRSAHGLVLLLPALLFLLPHSQVSPTGLGVSYNNLIFGNAQAVSDSGAESVGSTATGEALAETSEAASGLDTIAEAQISPTPEVSPTPAKTAATDLQTLTDLAGLDATAGTITVANEDFGSWMMALFANPDKYAGFTVTVTGYVFKDSTALDVDQFVPARLMMYCCVADLSPAGLICHYDDAAELEADSWVTVTGRLYVGTRDYDSGQKVVPMLEVSSVQAADKVEGYVYPY